MNYFATKNQNDQNIQCSLDVEVCNRSTVNKRKTRVKSDAFSSCESLWGSCGRYFAFSCNDFEI